MANVVADLGDKCTCKIADKEKCTEAKFLRPFDLDKSLIMDYSPMADKGLQDMIDIDELNHATILWNLYKRYTVDDIYTYVGPTLLAVNPFKRMDHKYPPAQLLTDYQQISNAGDDYYDLMRSMQPHVYAISAFAHKQMVNNKTRQAIVISGESGAGKTESARQAMAFLTSLGSKNIDPDKPPMGERILSTNPVLEAFGNSRTARNNNSSRFGKYVKLYFDQDDGKVLGAEIKNYLLEKSRVVGCTEKERNYHVFFFMMRGVDDAQARKLGLLKADGKRKDYPDFKYLSKCNDLSRDDDIAEYKFLIESFNKLGFTAAEQDAIHRMTAASMHMGEIEFDNSTYDDGKDAKPVSVKNKAPLKLVAELLGLPSAEDLELELVHKGAMDGVSGRTPDKPQNVANTKDSLAKAIFDNMFNWLVAKMNIEILPAELKSGDFSAKEAFGQCTKTVGLLDIFGFENFELNQFEQLCINFVNEKLHNLYISSVFGAEKKEMEREGIEVELVLPALKVLDILKLMDNPLQKVAALGIFQLVDDKSGGNTLGAKTMNDRVKELYNIILKNHEPNKEVFTKLRNSTKFTISHSAKDVIYDSKNFIERNADSMSESLAKLILQKTDKTVGQIYSQKTGLEPVEEEPTDPKQKKRGANIPKTIWGKFSIQIQELMNELAEPLIPKDFSSKGDDSQATTAKKSNDPPCEKCDLHFIRCLKPNDKKIPDFFAHAMTLQQITYMGVLESIKVKQENFPYRKKYEEFYRIYELLSPAYAEGRYDLLSDSVKAGRQWDKLSQQIIEKVFSPLNKEEYESFYALGKTKILKMGEAKLVLDKSKQKASAKYDTNSQTLKRSYKLMKANDELMVKKMRLLRIQRFMKKIYQRIQEKRANEFQLKLQKAIVAFKTEKRKDFEIESAEVIEKTYRKHVFRDHLNQAIVSRQFMMKGIFDLATVNRLRKMWICRRQVLKILDRAFKIGKAKKEQDSVYRIQRIIRGHMERNGKQELVLNAVKSKVELKQHVSAKKIQKRLKGLVVRRRIAFLSEKVSQIQATMKMKWTRRVYNVIRKNVIILQKAYRRYMARRDQIKVRLYKYLAQELQVIENVKAMEYSQLHGHNLNRQSAQQMGLLKALTPYSIKKIHFFSRVIDLGIRVDLSDIYTHPWSSQWIKCMSESTNSDCPIMTITAGQTHSMVVNSKGKVFAWGWNDNGQCAKSPDQNEVILGQSIKNAQINLDNIIDKDKQAQIQNQGGMRIKQAIAVEDRCFLLIQETNEIIAWGGNHRGQLGLGHYEDVFKPTKIDILAKAGVKITYISAGGDLNLACSEQGEAFAWPFIHNGIKQSIPTRMPFSEKTKILKVSCGHNFGFFISNQGLVYSFGEDNSDGQLGLGHVYPTEFPELIACFRDIGERIDTIECGFKHAIAKSSLGKIYTWGSSNKGQLGHDHHDSELSPRALNIDKKNNKKVTQIAAGYSHTMVMMDSNKEVYWFGTCGNLNDQSTPIMIDLPKYLPDLFGPQASSGGDQRQSDQQYAPYIMGSQQQDFAIVKINSTWSKTMSISNMMIADLRAVNQDQPHSKLISSLQNLGTRWDPKDIMPPYIDFISGLFPANIMKKPAVIKATKGGQKTSMGAQIMNSSRLGGKLK